MSYSFGSYLDVQSSVIHCTCTVPPLDLAGTMRHAAFANCDNVCLALYNLMTYHLLNIGVSWIDNGLVLMMAGLGTDDGGSVLRLEQLPSDILRLLVYL